MYCLILLLIFITLSCTQPNVLHDTPNADQAVMCFSDETEAEVDVTGKGPPRVAIVGAGIAGASSAHHLHQLYQLHQPLEMVVFEAEDCVGGRIQSAHINNEIVDDIESGAATFSEKDWCLRDAIQEVGLKTVTDWSQDQSTGVWDGHDFLVSYDKDDEPTRATWRSPQWLWRYGSSLPSLQGLIQKYAEKFASFARYRAFTNLPGRLAEHFTQKELISSATWFFEEKKISDRLVGEIIRAETRHQNARDLDEVNPLSSLLALRAEIQLSVFGGNQRLVNRMLKISEAKVRLNTVVSRIVTGEDRRWKVHTRSVKPGQADNVKLEEAEFDIVILTAPFAFSGIEIEPHYSNLASTAEIRPYIERHVTLFSTPRPLDPSYFNQSRNFTMPIRILTSPRRLGPSDKDNDIFSVVLAKKVAPPDSGDCIDELDNVYKIVSSQSIPDETIARLLGKSIDQASQKSSGEVLENLGVTWVHRRVWPQAYPQFKPNAPLLDNLEIAPDLYYTAAGEEVLSTMEMGCRMGFNIAKHLYYTKWAGKGFP